MSYKIEDWGLIEYQEALKRQEELLAQIADSDGRGTLVFCSHLPVVTLGRATKPEDVFAWSGPMLEISRGGRATYHGPSQLVIYPILNLNHAHGHRPAKDIGLYLRNFENAIVETLKTYGIESQGRSQQNKSENEAASDETGVWVGPHKIASLGIGVRRWVSFHGAAINLDYDPRAFQGLNPCGFKASTMISAEQLLGQKIDRPEFQADLLKNLLTWI
jgi:lipoyl(octanoyl) transferase